MNDSLDTNARCKTSVSLYFMNIKTLENLRTKHNELDEALYSQEYVLIQQMNADPKLDYIIRDPFCNQMFYKHQKTGNIILNYEEEEYRKKLTVKLKNAIMVYWLRIKKARKKPSFEEIIRSLQAKRKNELQNAVAFKEAKKKMRKEKRDRIKEEAQQKQIEAEAHLTSYINRDQFNHLYESILDINKKITDHSESVDDIEKKLLEVNKKRRNRKLKQRMIEM